MSLPTDTISGARFVGVQDRRARGVTLLRTLLLDPRPEEREAFANHCLRYSRAYLRRNWYRWAAGFESGYALALAGASDMAVALLLREVSEPYRLPHLDREFARVCATRTEWTVSPPGPGEGWSPFLAAAADVDLDLHLRSLLRLKTQQQMISEWKQAEPEKGRIWRRIKRRVKATPSLQIRRDARGWFLGRSDADLRARPLTREAVADLLGSGCPTIADALEILDGAFRSGEGHGGYCVLTDVVRIYADLAARKLVFAGEGTGALPCALGIRIAANGLPESAYVARVRDAVAEWAAKFLDGDMERLGRKYRPGWRKGMIEVVVEMVCRRFEMGRDIWRHRSQKDLAIELVPRSTEAGYQDFFRERLDYAIRRVREHLADKMRSTPRASLEGP